MNEYVFKVSQRILQLKREATKRFMSTSGRICSIRKIRPELHIISWDAMDFCGIIWSELCQKRRDNNKEYVPMLSKVQEGHTASCKPLSQGRAGQGRAGQGGPWQALLNARMQTYCPVYLRSTKFSAESRHLREWPGQSGAVRCGPRGRPRVRY